jgi:DNA-binding MarR family transcriptional regulator
MKMKKACTADPTKVHPLLTQYFGYCLYKAAMQIKALMDDATGKIGITTHQFGILVLLYETGCVSQIELSHEMQIDQASMVRFLDGLEKVGLIQRQAQPGDRRVKLVDITKKGRQAFKKIKEKRLAIERKFLSKLTSHEQKTVKELVAKIIR